MDEVELDNVNTNLNQTNQVIMKNRKLWEAFESRNAKLFDQLLENRENPAKKIGPGTNISTFELLCKNPEASEYLLKCLDYKTDPNAVNPNDGYYPIHLAVQNLAIQNIKILLKADAECANQTLNFDKTPLHLLAEVLNDTNLSTVFEVIKIFSEFDGNFSWPARQSRNQTPFSMLLEKLATLNDKVTCLKIIRFLIGKYPKIDMFQRERCAELIRKKFGELAEEYQIIASWNEGIKTHSHWKVGLLELVVENEAEFLVKYLEKKRENGEKLKKFFTNEDIILMSIDHAKYEIFVEICELNFENFNIEKAIERVLKFNRCRMLKYILNHDHVKSINPKWMRLILWQMEDEEIDMKPNALRCFHILLDHSKYEVNAQMADCKNITALHFAAMKSKYATLQLLKRGASLKIKNDFGHMPIQFIDNSTLKEFFDSLITKRTHVDRTDFFVLAFDYSFLKAPNETPSKTEIREMPLIEYLKKTKQMQSLIEHPVITSFLYLRWWKLSIIFFLNLLFFSVTALCFGIYLVFFYVNYDHQHSPNNGWFELSKPMAFVSFVCFTVKEVIQFIFSPRSYATSVTNYFEILVMILMTITLFKPFDEDPHTRRLIAAMLFLGFAIEWTLMLSALPVFIVSNL